MSNLKLQHFYDKDTYTLTYVVYDENSTEAVIIDPVLNYDAHSSTISQASIRELVEFIDEHKLSPKLILETHAHADHLTGAAELKGIFKDVKIGVGRRITDVQRVFKEVYHEPSWKVDGSQFDLLFDDDQVISLNGFKIRVISTPGHTPACVSYLIEDMLFTGDALFMPDYGTGRCDFPEGSADQLYDSIHRKLYPAKYHSFLLDMTTCQGEGSYGTRQLLKRAKKIMFN